MKTPVAPKLTSRQSAIIGLYTGIVYDGFGDIHALAEELTESSVFTHQFSDDDFTEKLKTLVKPLFLEICAD